MVLENAWQPSMAEKCYQEEGLKEEKNYLYLQSRDIRNNDWII